MESVEKLKSNKAVTLVALVVTIIVLIVLAGVSINLVLGDNGIIQKAKQAKTETEQSKLNEEVATNELIANWTNITGETIPYDNPYIPTGFSHIGTEDWNSGYRISDTGDETGNIFVWVPCVLSQDVVKDGDKVETFKKTLPATTDETDPYYMYNKNNLTIIGEEGTTASEIEESVGKYGGFYIAAYEAGIEGTTENYSLSKKTSLNTKPLSKPGKGIWNYITRANAIIVSQNMIDNSVTGAKSALISGACWDTTLQWMAHSSTNAAEEPNLKYDINSNKKGWHVDVSNSKRCTTGYYGVNNIYDMTGNVWEYTTENCRENENTYLINRGGFYRTTGLDFPAACRNKDTDYESNAIGFRVVLYK